MLAAAPNLLCSVCWPVCLTFALCTLLLFFYQLPLFFSFLFFLVRKPQPRHHHQYCLLFTGYTPPLARYICIEEEGQPEKAVGDSSIESERLAPISSLLLLPVLHHFHILHCALFTALSPLSAWHY